jgi:hypothetical protein
MPPPILPGRLWERVHMENAALYICAHRFPAVAPIPSLPGIVGDRADTEPSSIKSQTVV